MEEIKRRGCFDEFGDSESGWRGGGVIYARTCLLKGVPINSHSGQKQPYNFDEIWLAKAKLGKCLMEKYQSEHYLQLSYRYFV